MTANDNHSVTVLQRQLFSELVDYARRVAQVDLPRSLVRNIATVVLTWTSRLLSAPQQQQHLCHTTAEMQPDCLSACNGWVVLVSWWLPELLCWAELQVTAP